MDDFSSILTKFASFKAKRISQRYSESSRLHQACTYAMSGKGKYVRPVLTLLSAESVGASADDALHGALAVEMIHTYSLIHDDLPCMDDDDTRRGRPTVHKQFDEATALLAGDALLTDAFDEMGLTPNISADLVVQGMRVLSAAAGGGGMVQGQDLDLSWTGKQGYQQDDLEQIHRLKTGQLIAASCAVGCLLGAKTEYLHDFQSFGNHLGLAFQIIDDLLDDSTSTGKSVGKDKAQGKLTFLSMMSREDAAHYAKSVTEKAFASLEQTGLTTTDALRQFALRLLERKS
ncbi:MAG: polyprenyl synthetase family protein [Pseudobacteriovorax sp.]|nr:polyprenyl synthetase family protein [Pseudobacteriovorax sp.]